MVRSGDEYFDKYPIGNFYLTEKPEDSNSLPVIQKGALVRKGEVLYYVDSLRLHNPVIAPYDCIVRKILIKPGKSFDYGTKLLLLERTQEQ